MLMLKLEETYQIQKRHCTCGASLVAWTVKNLPAMWETWVRSLGQEDPLEKGNGNPVQYSCLDNSMDRGAWLSTIHGVAESGTHTHCPFLCRPMLWSLLNLQQRTDLAIIFMIVSEKKMRRVVVAAKECRLLCRCLGNNSGCQMWLPRHLQTMLFGDLVCIPFLLQSSSHFVQWSPKIISFWVHIYY